MMEKLSALVLDDNSTSLWSISKMLEKSNFRVFSFQTAEAALDFVKRGAAKEAELDLVLVDVCLNNMAPETLANPELLHHMNELQVPLITMSSYVDDEALSKCMTLGACFHVLKPLDTGSFNMLKHKALEHKSKKAKNQGKILNRTRNRMVRNNLSNPESNGHEEPKKPGRIKWTVELHEKFLEAIEVLGGEEFSTPEGILRQMNVKDLTSKHIASHLQKHRLQKRNAKQGVQRQGNASTKPVSELIIPARNEATSESITSGVAANCELYPLRLWKVKKRTVVLNTCTYTCSSGIYRDDTKSVWDEYQKNLQKELSGSNKRLLSSSIDQCPSKNKVFITGEVVPNEPHKTAGEIGYGASKSSGSSSLLTNDQVEENNSTETDRENDNVGSINLLEGEIGYGVCIERSGPSSLSTSDQVGQNNPPEVARDTDNLRNINMLEGYAASIKGSGSSNLLKSDQVRQINRTEATRDNDEAGNINLLEGITDMEYTAPMDPCDAWAHLEIEDLDLTGPSDVLEEVDSFFLSQCEGSQEQQSLGQDDLQQISDGVWNDALRSVSPINIGEPMVQGPQEQQSLVLEDLLRSLGPINIDEPMAKGSQEQQSLRQDDLKQICGDGAWNDALRSVGLMNIDEPMVQGSQEQQSLGQDDLQQVCDDAWNDALRSVALMSIGEPMAQGPQEEQSLALEDLPQVGDVDVACNDAFGSAGLMNIDEPVAQDYELWGWSPQVAGDYGMLLF